MNLLTRIRFRKDDPMRELHVPKKDRQSGDPASDEEDSTAVDDETGDDTDFDRKNVRNRGGVVPPEMLQ